MVTIKIQRVEEENNVLHLEAKPHCHGLGSHPIITNAIRTRRQMEKDVDEVTSQRNWRRSIPAWETAVGVGIACEPTLLLNR